MKSVGILALQGDFEKHGLAVLGLGEKPVYVRTPQALNDIDCIILPGGESTTIGMLLLRFSLLDLLKNLIREGMPTFATCAGTILLAKNIEASDQTRLGLLDISIRRNAYGSQVESFETDIIVPDLSGGPVRGVFIRAPFITQTGKNVEILARFESAPVLVRESNILASTFHPEIAFELRVHKYFLDSVK